MDGLKSLGLEPGQRVEPIKLQPVNAVSTLLSAAAQTLAINIEAGEFAALTSEQRCDLRGLAMALSSWADRVQTMEYEIADAASSRRRVGWRRWWAQVLRG